jgi:hypothetical protein
VSVLKPTRSIDRFQGFLEAQADWAWSTPRTETYSPALYAGIQEGLSLFSGKFGEMNELVVLGGQPNPLEDSRISPKALASLQVQTRTNIRVYQTYFPAGYPALTEQVAGIFAEGEAEIEPLVYGYTHWTTDTLLRDWALTGKVWRNAALSVSLFSPVAGKKLYMAGFGQNLSGWVKALQAKAEQEYATRQQTAAICAASTDTAAARISIPQTVDEFWTCAYMADAMEYFQDAIFPYKHDSLKEPLFEAAVLIEQNAVGVLVGYLNDVLATKEGSFEDRRNALYNVFLQIAGGYDGMRKRDASELANTPLRKLVAKDFYDISEQQYDLFKHGSVLAPIPLSDLKDRNVIPDDMINIIYLYFSECRDKVNAFSSKAETFLIGDTRYTWLPLDIAP